MIRVNLAPEPADFDRRVRRPGLMAIAELVGEPTSRRAGKRYPKVASNRAQIPPAKFPPYWTELADQLMASYAEVCAYSCFRIHPVTGSASTDHFAPKSRRWDQVYEWGNYRLACSRLNARKREFGDVLDPFEIQDGWFELELVGFQVQPAAGLPESVRQQVENTITRLELNDFSKTREEYAEDYWGEHVSFQQLQREAPFVARELRRQRRLRPGDA